MAIVNKAAMNVGGQIALEDRDLISFGRLSRNRIAGSYDTSTFWYFGGLFLFFKSPSYCFP